MSITVTRDLSKPMGQVLQIRNHTVAVDAPVEEGGIDTGPSPHDLYDAALAACKALTMVWYANRKDIPLREVRIESERDASDERRGIYRLATVLHLGGDLTDPQREELLAVARKCPVHKLMSSVTTEISTSLAARELDQAQAAKATAARATIL
jgi:putative redox protein